MNPKIIKSIFAAAFALYFTLIAFNNISDYTSNLAFVKGVLTMEDVFSNPANQWRAIQWPWAVPVIYGLIIIWESAIAIIIGSGAYTMFKTVNRSPKKFTQAKELVSMGYIMSFVQWFVFFVALAGEWFLMWQSSTWNAQYTAFSLTMITLGLLLFHHLVPEEH
jgi:predicted small integral membrane protein